MPAMVKGFLKKAEFQTEYFFSDPDLWKYTWRRCRAGTAGTETMRERADYINTLKMIDNFLPSFDMEEQIASEHGKYIEKHLSRICSDIKKRIHWIQPATEEDRLWHQKYLEYQKSVPTEQWKHIYQVTEECIGCGICDTGRIRRDVLN